MSVLLASFLGILIGLLSLAQTIVIYGLIGIIVLLVVAIFTKPEPETFDLYFKNLIKEKVNSRVDVNEFGILTPLVKGGLKKSLTSQNIQTSDIVIAKIVTVKYNGTNDYMTFVGAFKSWYLLENKR